MNRRSVRKIELPPDFAQQILDSEIEFKLSDKPSKQVIRTLVQLYSLGVEYYESIRSHKYLYFQQKMNEIFTSASTMTAINDKQPISDADSPLKRKIHSKIEQQKIQAIKFKRHEQQMMQQVIEKTNQSATMQTAKQIINDCDLKNLANSEKLKKQIQDQNEKFRQKLERRRSRLLLSKSMTYTQLSGQSETRQSLFMENSGQGKVKEQQNTHFLLKPLQVDFSNVINEDQSDDNEEQVVVKKRRLSMIQSAKDKKAKSWLDLFDKHENKHQDKQQKNQQGDTQKQDINISSKDQIQV